jgi:predicted nuclease of restriction endonuclease-like (RecB) superfamily
MSKLENRQPAGLLRQRSVSTSTGPEEQAFAEVVAMIQASRGRALAAINTGLVDLYWRIGEYISRKLETAAWGEGVVEALARYIQQRQPNLRGFTRRSLFRMRQFFEAYRETEKVSALLTQLPWTHHLLILGQCKRPEEREFYLRLTIRERWSSRELERQLRTAAFERAVLSPAKVSAAVAQIHPEALDIFKDSYLVEFLELPKEHSETDLHRALVHRLRDFLIELGRDFCFVGSEYPVQVGNRDFALDLLFFHRGLNCLCASKDSEVVEYALSRSLSPALVAEYKTQLPDKKLLQAKLHEIYRLTVAEAE